MTKIELYNAAKEAYYNGEPIMTDIEFDELEKELGLENKSYVGAKHNPSYTIQHPFIMGSLSKVQIKHNDDNSISWEQYFQEVCRYIHRNYSDASVIITPKYDGCSFEAIINNHEIVSISTRGDGNFGRDIKNHLLRKFDSTHTVHDGEYTLRGEVLIDKKVFADKYSEFVNPRSFVSGLLNRDYDPDDKELNAMLDDLSIVIYDTRYIINGEWRDYDWTDENGKMHCLPEFYQEYFTINLATFERIYHDFEKYRNECQFALDGIVIKPTAGWRTNNTTEARPKDCVAVKFIPMLEETEIVDIEWNMSKTGELCPVIITKPVIMDGKKITRASAHNYGYLLDNRISIGSRVVLSLAGDIIPFIYKITNTDKFDASRMHIPDCEYMVDGCHLMKILSEEGLNEQMFIESANALSIPCIGEATAKSIYAGLKVMCSGDDFLDIEATAVPTNILELTGAQIADIIGGKAGMNAMKEFDKFKKDITLADVIVSCNFNNCGHKAAKQVAQELLFGNGNFEHIPEKAWSWCRDKSSINYLRLMSLVDKCGKTIDMFKNELAVTNENTANQIPVILTGEPNDYNTKQDFLNKHPEYRLTSSWKEVQIVFTNDLDSNTGKMKKAREKGITIKLY